MTRSTPRFGRARRLLTALGLSVALPATFAATAAAPANAAASGGYSCWINSASCTANASFSASGVPNLGPASTYASPAARSAFPATWTQLQGNQQHNPVYPLPAGAPSWLSSGLFWASPVTGNEYLRLGRAFNRYGSNGGQSWGSEVAQWLGNATGVTVANGIVYVDESHNEIVALDAKTGRPIWTASTVNGLMGDPLVTTVNGTPMVFAAAGDVGFTIQNALKFAVPGVQTTRGANFSAVYAFNALTGQRIWRFDTAGEAMPTPVYKNGSLFFDTGDNHLYAVNAATGTLESAFSNPGFSSMSSANWFTTATGQLEVIFGTQHAGALMAVNETNPSAPTLAWQYLIPNALNTGAGDVPPVVDPNRNLVLTDSLVNDIAAGGTAAKPVLNINVFAVNATTGQLVWSTLAGSGSIKPYSFKGSVPMVHGGNLYVGDLLNQTYQSYNETTGQQRWMTSLTKSTDPAGIVHQPRGGATFWNGKIIEAEGRDIWTIDPNTGKILNDFTTPGGAAVWGIPSPVIVGNEMYLGAISGWVFAAPASFITTSPGYGAGQPLPQQTYNTPPQTASYYDPAALPTNKQAQQFPSTNVGYGQQETNGDGQGPVGQPDARQGHNAVTTKGPSGVSWSVPLPHALALNGPPRDQAIFGTQVATAMTAQAFGAGAAVAPVSGIAYVGSGNDAISALNAITGKLIWQYQTLNADLSAPLVTHHVVVVASGDPWINFSGVTALDSGAPTHIGASFQSLHGLNPTTGKEMWTFYTQGSDQMTPLYHKGKLIWVNGAGHVWAIWANSGKPVSTFVNSAGNPNLQLPGFNDLSTARVAQIGHANMYKAPNGHTIMVVGTANPNTFYGIDLHTDTIVWSQNFSSLQPSPLGLAASSAVVDQQAGTVISDLLMAGANGQVTTQAFALNAATGAVVWTQSLGSGPQPAGFSAATPILQNHRVYFADPVTGNETAVNAQTGAVLWTTPLGGGNRAAGAIVGNVLLQPAGPNLVAMNIYTGKVLHVTTIGGSFNGNSPTVAGQTVYIGNSYGWAMALPLAQVLGQ